MRSRWIHCSGRGSYGGISYIGCGSSGGRDGLAGSSDLILHFINRLTQRKGSFQFLHPSNAIIVVKRARSINPLFQCTISLVIHADIMFALTRFVMNSASSASSSFMDFFFWPCMVRLNYSVTTMKSCVDIANALWCCGWTALIQGIKGRSLLLQVLLWKMRAGVGSLFWLTIKKRRWEKKDRRILCLRNNKNQILNPKRNMHRKQVSETFITKEGNDSGF